MNKIADNCKQTQTRPISEVRWWYAQRKYDNLIEIDTNISEEDIIVGPGDNVDAMKNDINPNKIQCLSACEKKKKKRRSGWQSQGMAEVNNILNKIFW